MEGTKMSYGYIEVDLILDSHDLIIVEALLKERIKELRKTKAESEMGMVKHICDNHIFDLNDTLKKIKAARIKVKEVKAEADAKFSASLKAKRATRK
jgi:hypothetical protein